MKPLTVKRHQNVGDFMSSPAVTVGPETTLAMVEHVMMLRGISNLALINRERRQSRSTGYVQSPGGSIPER